jgi:predicted  nucleic acid-binding Zn-ribbon protein
MHLTDTKQNQLAVNKLQKKASNKLVEKELPQIPGAIKRFEKLENEVKRLKKQVKGLEKRVQDLVAEKKQHEMGGDK